MKGFLEEGEMIFHFCSWLVGWLVVSWFFLGGGGGKGSDVMDGERRVLIIYWRRALGCGSCIFLIPCTIIL